MINWLPALTVSLLVMWSISVDIKEHDNRRSMRWVAVGFLLGIIGGIIYIAYDRIRK